LQLSNFQENQHSNLVWNFSTPLLEQQTELLYFLFFTVLKKQINLILATAENKQWRQ